MTFHEAINVWYSAMIMKDDLPDGQAAELRKLMDDFKAEYGLHEEWDDVTKEEFSQEVEQNITYWV